MQKRVLTTIIITSMVLMLFTACDSSKISTETRNSSQAVSVVATETSTPPNNPSVVATETSTPPNNPSDNTTSKTDTTSQQETHQYEDTDYVEIYNNPDSYKDKYVRIFGKISSIGKDITDNAYITFKEGIKEGITHSILCNISDEQKDTILSKYAKDDYVAIEGKVSNKIIGSVNIDDCFVTLDGEEVKAKVEDFEKQRTAKIEKSTEKPTEKSTPEPTEKPTEKKEIKSLQHGKLVSVIEQPGNNRYIVIKAKIKPNLTNRMTINQNYFNIADVITKQGGNEYETIDYWAVADMSDGEEAKVISFTLDSATIQGIYNGNIVTNQIGEYAKDLWIHPSLKS